MLNDNLVIDIIALIKVQLYQSNANAISKSGFLNVSS
jgi:hypothetical protein